MLLGGMRKKVKAPAIEASTRCLVNPDEPIESCINWMKRFNNAMGNLTTKTSFCAIKRLSIRQNPP
jgi:hypothetical protein